MAFKKVTATRTIKTTLSTGTVMTVAHAKSAEGEDAWCTELVATDGETLKFGISHEAFQVFVAGVAKLYGEAAGFTIN